MSLRDHVSKKYAALPVHVAISERNCSSQWDTHLQCLADQVRASLKKRPRKQGVKGQPKKYGVTEICNPCLTKESSRITIRASRQTGSPKTSDTLLLNHSIYQFSVNGVDTLDALLLNEVGKSKNIEDAKHPRSSLAARSLEEWFLFLFHFLTERQRARTPISGGERRTQG